jgi:membrane protease YdiL (CAAX protease family)
MIDVEIVAETAAVLAVVTAPLWMPLAFLIYALARWRFSWTILAWLVAAEVLSVLAADVVRSQLRG